MIKISGEFSYISEKENIFTKLCAVNAKHERAACAEPSGFATALQILHDRLRDALHRIAHGRRHPGLLQPLTRKVAPDDLQTVLLATRLCQQRGQLKHRRERVRVKERHRVADAHFYTRARRVLGVHV